MPTERTDHSNTRPPSETEHNLTTQTQPAPTPRPPSPLRWDREPTTEQVGLWWEFVTWAEWFLRHYEVHESIVPSCWSEHPVIVEELTALWTGYRVAYEPAASGWTSLLWHEKAAAVIERFRSMSTHLRCTPATGHEPSPIPRSPGSVPVSPAYVFDLGLPKERGPRGG